MLEPLPFLLGLQLAPPSHEATSMRAYHRPEGCSPHSIVSRRLAASPAEPLRQRLHGRVHFRPHHSQIDSSARFACPPFREHLRAGFPALLVTPGS